MTGQNIPLTAVIVLVVWPEPLEERSHRQDAVLGLPEQQFDIVYCWGVLHHTGRYVESDRTPGACKPA